MIIFNSIFYFSLLFISFYFSFPFYFLCIFHWNFRKPNISLKKFLWYLSMMYITNSKLSNNNKSGLIFELSLDFISSWIWSLLQGKKMDWIWCWNHLIWVFSNSFVPLKLKKVFFFALRNPLWGYPLHK